VNVTGTTEKEIGAIILRTMREEAVKGAMMTATTHHAGNNITDNMMRTVITKVMVMTATAMMVPE
jgi:hypothetical protein